MKFRVTSVSTTSNSAGSTLARMDGDANVDVLTNVCMEQERYSEGKEKSLVSDLTITYLGHPRHKVKDLLDIPIESAILGLK